MSSNPGSQRQQGAFSGRVVALLIGVGLLSFTAAALVGIYADPQTESTSGANAYSHSAIGHKAWTEILQELGVPVILSRSESADKAYYNDGLLVLAQPDSSGEGLAALDQFGDTDRVLVVLPKWDGWSGYENRRWIKNLRLRDAESVQKVLDAIDPEATLVRAEEDQAWRSVAWDVLPTLSGAQLIRSDEISPIVYSDAGVLLGEYGGVWVLSDPDVINNAGIDEGDNAAFAAAIVAAQLPPGSSVIFDETIHGFALSPDLWKALLSFPLNLAVLQGLTAAAVLVWAAAGRFGAPRPPGSRLQAGKEVLIANTASLFEYAGRLSDILRRYRDTTLRDLAQHLHIPRELTRNPDDSGLTYWLNQVGDARGTTERYSEVNHAVASVLNGPGNSVPALLRAAAQLYRWKQEMIHGHRADSDGLRRGSRTGAQDRHRTGRRA